MLSEIKENGWPPCPFQIVSLFEMLKAYAHAFYVFGGMLRSVDIVTSIGLSGGDKPTNSATRDYAVEHLEGMRQHCAQMGLGLSLKGIERAAAEISKKDITYIQHGAALAELERRINDELRSIYFFHVPQQNARYYPNSQEYEIPLLTPYSKKKFPKSIEDSEEAGKCFALGRYTACVFHLMRVMERGVQRLGKKLKVAIPVEEKDWGVISSSINGALRRLPNSTVAERKIHARYAKAAVYLDNVREAWRNPTMHPKETYTEEEAEDCFRFVKQYTEHLAKIL